MEDLVTFPESGYTNTGEGGMAVFFVLLTFGGHRQKCIAGEGEWPKHDVVTGPGKYRRLNNKPKDGYDNVNYGEAADLVMLIGSTKSSLWRDELGYWYASKKDLTEKGKQLYALLTQILGEKPDIVTLLDT